MRIIILLVAALALVSCGRKIPPELQEALQKQFTGEAMETGWQFVKVTHGFGGQELVADILVQQPIPGPPEAQQARLKSEICPPPAGNDTFWQKLQGYKLSVAAYTKDRKFTVLVDCDNPFAVAEAGK
ncbi:hypothetical protein [Methylomagnum ishizawai]|uniref:hypothetical protein n=1 Tax=Methylomagnum ishizawai TaxID=1760988 RepID=UPI001C3277A6|nr:hypothetical protein [Methylomagnum ishizawai]BBL75832.1 hypothetical protein MishRS11D_29300 [Methylomagnum ishizawai]